MRSSSSKGRVLWVPRNSTVAVYVADTLHHSPCPMFDDVGFDCSTWFSVKLTNDKTSWWVWYIEVQTQVMKITISCCPCWDGLRLYLTLCDDYNLPRIEWNAKQCFDSDGSYSRKFLDTIDELGLFRHATKPTRFRGEQKSCLDLIFTNEEDMVEEVGDLPPIRKSDHICQRWELVVSEVTFRNTATLRRNFKKANWDNIKTDL